MFLFKSRGKRGYEWSQGIAGASEALCLSLYLSVSVAVKFLWPVGGALMQCFKERDPSGSKRREEEEGG